ncbi:MAG: hypothetical protein PHT51_03120 [Patescibacteria group bacterium]|nr:hypothetical protein [Patescibacteria group bacterium]MDD4611131.1 hypothetical protein [Patescibacteria group bacterium]
MEKDMNSKQGGKAKSIITIIIVIVVIAALGYGIYRIVKRGDSSDSAKIQGYQAVFLSNGQVYFGKVSGLEKDYAELSEVYYLQRKTPLQNQVPAEGDATAQAQAQSQLTLIKLGNEIHGPKDTMILNQKHILFVENLKDDSKIVEAIKAYQTKQAETPAQPQK